MNKIFIYGWEILKISWKANGILSIISIFSNIYQNTLFPFIQVFLLAQVLDLIQKKHSLQIADIVPYAIAYIIFAIINTSLNSFINNQQFYMDVNLDSYLDRMILEKL